MQNSFIWTTNAQADLSFVGRTSEARFSHVVAQLCVILPYLPYCAFDIFHPLMFHSNTVKISDILNKCNLFKICTQTTCTFDFLLFIYFFFLYIWENGNFRLKNKIKHEIE